MSRQFACPFDQVIVGILGGYGLRRVPRTQGSTLAPTGGCCVDPERRDRPVVSTHGPKTSRDGDCQALGGGDSRPGVTDPAPTSHPRRLTKEPVESGS